MEKLEVLVKDLKDPSDYLDGVSASYRYIPEKLVFFSRLKTLDIVNIFPMLHSRFNLVFSLKGSLQIHIDNHTLTLNEGESLLIFPFQSHYYSSVQVKELVWLFIGFDLKERRGLEVLRNNTVNTGLFVPDCLERMFSASDNLKVSLLSAILLSNIENAESQEKINFKKDKVRKDSLITKAQKYVFSNPGIMLTTSAVAIELGISDSSLYKLFKKNIGISPGRFLREIRINYACSILETGEFTITETASLCGYDSVYSFSRTFKKVSGYSPGVFKKRYNDE